MKNGLKSLKSMQNSNVFSAFQADFCSKHKNSLPQRDLGAEVLKDLPSFGPVYWSFWSWSSPKVNKDLFSFFF